MRHMCNSVTTPINKAETTSQLKGVLAFVLIEEFCVLLLLLLFFSLCFEQTGKSGRVLHSIGSFKKERIG